MRVARTPYDYFGSTTLFITHTLTHTHTHTLTPHSHHTRTLKSIVIPELEAVPGGNVDFEVAVVSKCAFELRVAAPGSARASDTGVVWVSGRP